MSFRSGAAKAASGALTWGLRHIARRPAGNLPGKAASRIDPAIISELRWKLRKGSIVVVGTNGKTSVTNMLADALEAEGLSVLCNRTGANLKSGIASALLQGKPSDWGVIECDELWTAKVVPDLQPTYFLLLNLFRDQLDRCGEIDRIQDTIASALESSPETTLIYNADDPLCEFIAKRVRADAGEGTRTVAFGISEDMGLAQNKVSDATMCQACSHMFEYDYRQYGQLGTYRCPNCGFERPPLDFDGSDVRFSREGVSLIISQSCENGKSGLATHDGEGHAHDGGRPTHIAKIHSDLQGSYIAYNLLAVYAAAHLAGADDDAIQRAIDVFDPHNGRLQRYYVDGRPVLLNLAKNPTGFNQNLRIVSADDGPKGVAFFINDEVVDGHDISWIWDIDFEELSGSGQLVVFAGGKRANDLQVRLKYAGIPAILIGGIDDAFKKMDELASTCEMPRHAPLYAIANYSALPPVKHALDHLQDKEVMPSGTKDAELEDGCDSGGRPRNNDVQQAADKIHAETSANNEATSPIVIAHVLPDLLNLYGDGGNLRILEQRLNWRGIPVEIRRISFGQPIRFDDVDLVLLGGGPDREQKLATEELFKVRDAFTGYIEEGGPVLAICGGYQILGRTWLLGDEEVPGLGVLGIETRRPGTSSDRLVDNVALDSPIAKMPVVGYENHAGRTYLDEDVQPFGRVISHTGAGNADDAEGPLADGVLSGNILGTYLHGTLLSKNPEIADWLLDKAAERHANRTGEERIGLASLNDEEERAANAFMAKRLGAHK